MKYNYEQFKKYIKDNGVTDARTTENWKDIPKGTLIKFGLYDGLVSSYEYRLQGKKQYEYDFDVKFEGRWRDDGLDEDYKGLFEVEDEIIKEKDGIKVGDKVKFDFGGKTYKGYVAVIDPRAVYDPFLLRLDRFNGSNCTAYWNKDWYPQSENKEEKNCFWVKKEEFRVIKVGPIKSKLSFTINNAPKKAQTYMSIISNAFKSKENKALEYFNLGTTETLSERGRQEFIDFLWETLKEEKKAFLSKMVEAYKEDKE